MSGLAYRELWSDSLPLCLSLMHSHGWFAGASAGTGHCPSHWPCQQGLLRLPIHSDSFFSIKTHLFEPLSPKCFFSMRYSNQWMFTNIFTLYSDWWVSTLSVHYSRNLLKMMLWPREVATMVSSRRWNKWAWFQRDLGWNPGLSCIT